MTNSNESWDLFSISYRKSLWMCSHLQNPVSEWKQFQIYSYAALKCKSKTKKDYSALTNLFFKTGFCKNEWKSTEVIWFATPRTAFKETHVTKCMQHAKESMQKHCCSWDSTVYRGEYHCFTHIWQFCKVFMFHSTTCERLRFYVADRQMQNTLTDSSICQLHAKCNPRPSLRLSNRKV